ncbi:invasion associated locus B family protein [Jannaschia sp. 2305UL9-9]|uniref:invasion associated locus B family protein n=1 Tax=Jannaschia sp. 2305UL9-9 TaxID=3121638 RepID=UPI0035271EEB
MIDMQTRFSLRLAPALALTALIGIATVPGVATAQTTDADAETTTETTAEPTTETSEETTGADDAAASVLSTGEPVQQANTGPNIYVREEHGDWEVRCLEAPEGQEDPCQMFQRLSDQSGNPTADINIFDLPDGGDIVAGATIVTPLQTLLTAQVTVTIDSNEPRRYPFAFCDTTGCFARMGFQADDIARMRRGAKAIIRVVPAQAPDQAADLTMSLTGFTAGYEAVTVAN